jgi:predicted NBD/HSP70 family sugar kinase
METKRDGLFNYHTLSDKEQKNLTILELIRKKGPISRTDISKITDINIVSISNYIKNYLDKKYVVEKGFNVSSGGRRPELVEFNSKGCYVIGVDISSHELIAVMTDLAINIVKKLKVPKPKGSSKNLAALVIELIQGLITGSGIDKSEVCAIGLGITGLDFSDVRSRVEEKFAINTYMATEAACAAFGEKRLNPLADVEDMLYMHSDVGCGIVIRGDIYFGAGGFAGEMHLFNEKLTQEEKNNLFRGAQYLRPWCVDLGITESAKREIERGIGTKMVAIAGGDINNLTKQVVIEAARQQDDIALDILKGVGVNLGIRTAYLVNLFDPELVIIGGGIERAGDLVLEPIRSAVRKFSFNKQADHVKVIPSELGEDGVCLGAASLAIREIFIKA